MIYKDNQRPRNTVSTIDTQTHKSKSYNKETTKLCSLKFF